MKCNKYGRPKRSVQYVSKKVFFEQKDWEFLSREAHNRSIDTGEHISMAHLIRTAVNNQFIYLTVLCNNNKKL